MFDASHSKRPLRAMDCSTADKGAALELKVAAEFLLKGWDVFRSISSSASCDLIVKNDSQCFSVEVRTTGRMFDKIVIPRKARDNADIYATEFDGKILLASPENTNSPTLWEPIIEAKLE